MEVGLFPANLTVNENETFPVCARLTIGILGRDVIIPLVVESGSAVGETINFYNPFPLRIFHYLEVYFLHMQRELTL